MILPDYLIAKILLWNIHPTAEIIKVAIKKARDLFEKYEILGIEFSFAIFYFVYEKSFRYRHLFYK